jgi:predicted transcriptional regulator
LSGCGKYSSSRTKIIDEMVDTASYGASLVGMDVPLNPDLQTKLERLAEQQGRASTALIVEAVERMVNYDEWFLLEVDKGLASADRGELVDHSDVGKMIDERYPG